MKVKNRVKEKIALDTEKMNKTDEPLTPELLAKNARLLASGELSVGRPDLSL